MPVSDQIFSVIHNIYCKSLEYDNVLLTSLFHEEKKGIANTLATHV